MVASVFCELRARRVATSAAFGLILAGCVNEGVTEPEASRFSPTKEEQAELIAYGHARAISKGCPPSRSAGLLPNNVEFERVLGQTIERARTAGVRVQYETATLLGISKTDAAKIGAAYRSERGIVAGDRETWCRAGRLEIANKSRIGKYLYEYKY